MSSFYASEKNFRRYEILIGQVIQNYPHHYVVDNLDVLASGLQLSTFVARLRDAFASYRKNKWVSIHIDSQLFEKAWPDIYVSPDEARGTVMIGSRVKKASKLLEVPTSSQPDESRFSFGVKEPTPDIITACITLMHYRVLVKPILLLGDHSVHLNLVKPYFDISFEVEAGNTILF